MEDWKERLIKEKRELESRLQKLEDFMESDEFEQIDKKEKKLMFSQSAAMTMYYIRLSERILLIEETE